MTGGLHNRQSKIKAYWKIHRVWNNDVTLIIFMNMKRHTNESNFFLPLKVVYCVTL